MKISINKIIGKYEKLYERNPYSDPYFLILVEVERWNKLLNEYRIYSDGKPLLSLRKGIIFFVDGFSLLCQTIVNSTFFKIFMSGVLIANIIVFVQSLD
jgi:hypothetical protein